jgi:hypothetical protein
MRLLVVAALALVLSCSKGDGKKDRCVALMKKEEACVPPLPMSEEARAIKAATDGGGYSKLGASMCMLQFDDPEALDGADQRLAAHYAALLACSEKTKTCDEYMACACEDPTRYIQCKKPEP